MATCHIFLSYARRDGGDHAERLERELPAHGFQTWRDTRGIEPTQDFTAEIEKALEAADVVIACITPDVKRDDSFVRRELGYALALRKPVLVARFADIVPPIAVVNNTYFDFFNDSSGPLSRLLAYLSRDPTTLELHERPDAVDPFRPYLETLYRQVVLFLDKTVLKGRDAASSVLPLGTEAVPGVVPATSDALPRGFFDVAGVADDSLNGLGASPVFNTLNAAFGHYGHRLLLLGVPGSGKTTALMAFAREAIARRLDDPMAPLPIVAPIAAWDPELRPNLATWIANIVPPLADRIREVLDHEKALLMLDGLDELGDRLKTPPADGTESDPRVLFLRLVPPGNQVLVTSRLNEYRKLARQAPLNGAVTLRALDDDQIAAYLAPFPELHAIVAHQPGLREALRIPLLLSLFTVAFAGQGAPGGCDLSSGSVRDAIFELFIRRRYDHEQRKPHALMPFTLAEIYDHLGSIIARVDPYLPGGGWWDAPTLLTQEHIRERFGHERGVALIDVLTRLNLLVLVDDQRLRFLHLLLRDHLAFKQATKLAASAMAKVRVGATVILRELRDPRSIPILTTAADDPRQQVRWNATAALADLREPAAIPALIGRLADRAQPTWGDAYDQTPPAYWIAAEGLLSLGALAVEPLIAALQAGNPQVCGLSAYILGQIGSVDAVPALRACAARSLDSDTADVVGWSTERVELIVHRSLDQISDVEARRSHPTSGI